MKIDIRFALVFLIIGVLYASFVAPMHFEQKLIKSTALEKKHNEIRH